MSGPGRQVVVPRAMGCLLPWVPVCRVCGITVESVSFDFLAETGQERAGKRRYRETGMVRVTICCHGDRWVETAVPTFPEGSA